MRKMNKKIITLIIVILISLCFIGIVVAENSTHSDNSTDDNDNQPIDKNDTPDHNKSDKDKKDHDDKSKKDYILAKGKGNNIKFSDGFRGFILDYSKPSAHSGDEYKSVSTSKASNSNKLKLAIIECYKQNSSGQIEKIMADFVKKGSSNTKVGKAVASSTKIVNDHEVVKIDNHTEAIFDFEVLKSVSGNESDYFAYKVSFKSIEDTNDTENNETLLNNTLGNQTNITNLTNTSNITNATPLLVNETNSTLLGDLYDFLLYLANALYDAWKPLIDTLTDYILGIINALEEFTNMINSLWNAILDFVNMLESLFEGIETLLEMLKSLFKELAGLIALLESIFRALEQLLNYIGEILNFIAQLISGIFSLLQQILDLIGSILNFIIGLIIQIISFIISLIQQLLGLLWELLEFIMDLINQIISALKALLDFLKSIGSSLVNIVEQSAIIIAAFVIIVIGAFIYNNRIR